MCTYIHYQGRSQKFVSEGDKTGGMGTEVPQWWRSGGEAPEVEDIYDNNHCNNVLTKKPYFFNMGISGGGHVPPSICLCTLHIYAYRVNPQLLVRYIMRAAGYSTHSSQLTFTVPDPSTFALAISGVYMFISLVSPCHKADSLITRVSVSSREKCMQNDINWWTMGWI